MGYKWNSGDALSSSRLNETGAGIIKLVAGEAIDTTTSPKAIYISYSDGKAYMSNASALSTSFFDGVAIKGQNISIGGDIYCVLTLGQVGDLTSLTSGNQMYVGDTAGLIQSTAGTNIVRVGIAISTTDVYIDTLNRFGMIKQMSIKGGYTVLLNNTSLYTDTTFNGSVGDSFSENSVQYSSSNSGGNATRVYNYGISFNGSGIGYNKRMSLQNSIKPNTYGANDFACVGFFSTSNETSITITADHVGFIFDSTGYYASNADGTTQTTTDITSFLISGQYNTCLIEMLGTSYNFWVNGSIVATHTTNISTSTNTRYTIRISNNSVGVSGSISASYPTITI